MRGERRQYVIDTKETKTCGIDNISNWKVETQKLDLTPKLIYEAEVEQK